MTDRPDLQGALVSSSDIAGMLGVSRGAESNYKKRHAGIPPPAYTDRSGKIRLYWADDVERWAVEHFGADDLETTADDLERKAATMRERAERLRSIATATDRTRP